MNKFKINDRVRRIPYTVTLATGSDGVEETADTEIQTTSISMRGCLGTVKSLREETTNNSSDARDRSVMVEVLWDNGTLSYHGVEGLEATNS